MRREPALLSSRKFDLLVIGGGITGSAIARDAAMRGMSVALVEKDDFASGTSSRSSKLVHGGLRYLEHGDLVLVRESCRERQRLLATAPHLVKPLSFLLPWSRGGGWPPYLILRAGLLLYDIFAGRTRISFHHGVSAGELVRLEPGLNGAGAKRGAQYYDAVMDDARVALEVALGAVQAGAVALNHAEVKSLLRDGNGRIDGATVHDIPGNRDYEVRARLVINASGPWGDGILRLAGRTGAPVLRPTKGVHLIMKIPLTSHALMVRAKEDKRVFFVIPWQGLTIIGTTDTDYSGDINDIQADENDIKYLLDQAAAVLPGARIRREDILCAYAGVRPLLAGDPSHPSATSREHRIWEEPAGLLSVMGGKYTTFRAMAEDSVNKARKILGLPRTASPTRNSALPGAEPAGETGGNYPAGQRERLEGIYGTRAGAVLNTASRMKDGFLPLCPHTSRTRAEAVFAVEEEFALTLTDVLERRLRLALTCPCRGEDAVDSTVGAIAPLLGWDEGEKKRHAGHYLGRLKATRIS
jgi:glycerol-3-phosphate dehydrogenase